MGWACFCGAVGFGLEGWVGLDVSFFWGDSLVGCCGRGLLVTVTVTARTEVLKGCVCWVWFGFI